MKPIELDIENMIFHQLTADEVVTMHLIDAKRADLYSISNLECDVMDLHKRGYLQNSIKKKQITVTTPLDQMELTDKAREHLGMSSKNDIEALVKQYRLLFLRTTVGMMADESVVTSRMIWFKTKYPDIQDEDILDATKAYVASESGKRNNYQYMVNAANFIRREKSMGAESMLAAWCEQRKILKDTYGVDPDDGNYGLDNIRQA